MHLKEYYSEKLIKFGNFSAKLLIWKYEFLFVNKKVSLYLDVICNLTQLQVTQDGKIMLGIHEKTYVGSETNSNVGSGSEKIIPDPQHCFLTPGSAIWCLCDPWFADPQPIFMRLGDNFLGKKQCCGSGMFIPDPGSWFLPIPDPRSRILDPKTATKEMGEKKFDVIPVPLSVATNSQNCTLF